MSKQKSILTRKEALEILKSDEVRFAPKTSSTFSGRCLITFAENIDHFLMTQMEYHGTTKDLNSNSIITLNK